MNHIQICLSIPSLSPLSQVIDLIQESLGKKLTQIPLSPCSSRPIPDRASRSPILPVPVPVPVPVPDQDGSSRLFASLISMLAMRSSVRFASAWICVETTLSLRRTSKTAAHSVVEPLAVT